MYFLIISKCYIHYMQNNNKAKKFGVNNFFTTYIIDNYQFYNRIVIIYNNRRNVFILNMNVIKKAKQRHQNGS